MIKAILFDFGGVIFSNKSEYDGPKGMLDIDPDLWNKAGLGQIDDTLVFEGIAKTYSVDKNTIKEWLLSRREPNVEILNLLSNLNPNIKKAIINNGLKTLFHDLLDKYHLKDRFDLLINSAEEGVKKPDAEIYLRACQRLDLKPNECLMVDDNQEYLDGAAKLGMQTILYTNIEHLEQQFHNLRLLKN